MHHAWQEERNGLARTGLSHPDNVAPRQGGRPALALWLARVRMEARIGADVQTDGLAPIRACFDARKSPNQVLNVEVRWGGRNNILPTFHIRVYSFYLDTCQQLVG